MVTVCALSLSDLIRLAALSVKYWGIAERSATIVAPFAALLVAVAVAVTVMIIPFAPWAR